MAFDEPAGNRQTQASALAFGRKKRFKDALAQLLWDARAAVLHEHLHTLMQSQTTFSAMLPCPLSLRERVRVRVPKGLRTCARTLTPRPLPWGEGARAILAMPKEVT